MRDGRLSAMRTGMQRGLWSVAALIVASAVLAWLAGLDAAVVAPRDEIKHTDIERVLRLAREHDPRRATAGRISAVSFTERDLDLLLNHAARRWVGARMAIQLEPGLALVQTSARPPGWPRGPWINLQAQWRETAGLPQLESLRLGRLPLPAWLARRVLHAIVVDTVGPDDLDLVKQVVQRLQFGRDRLHVVYVWHANTATRALAALTPVAELQRLRAYVDKLIELAGAESGNEPLSLARWLGPMFQLAQQRSVGGDAVAETRAAVLSLALYVTGRGPESIAPMARLWPRPRRLRLTLLSRDDFAQHLLVSAALAIEGSSPLAAAVGLYKEVDDARQGSGFSFNDMAANRAGTRMGELALQNPRLLQARLAATPNESSLIPDMTDLPEFLGHAEFRRRFGAVGSPSYEGLMKDIERRVSDLALYR